MDFADLANRASGRYQRTSARWLFRRPFRLHSDVPLISFTFDDFPRSALLTGGSLLTRFGVRGTYYASFGLMGGDGPTGPIFRREDIRPLLEAGHELGCHTFEHCHAWQTDSRLFEQSVIRNQATLDEIHPRTRFRSLSYPISPPRPMTKRAAARRFACCRGGGQTFNHETTDAGYLAAYFLEKDRDHPEVVERVIDQNARANGWLILATHDVCDDPTPFGCTPAFFERILSYAVGSGARIVPVIEAWSLLRAESPPLTLPERSALAR
jgi:peptidoglycan/xylan/chitin deacetylase (PgdA/CDA1 family)